MAALFLHYPPQPASDLCQKGYVILCNAHDAADSFLDIFQTVRQNRNARGTPTDEEQDLLRAALVFASAGLDSLVKQLIVDALPAVLSDEAASQMFRTYVEKRLRVGEDIDCRMLADVVTHCQPRERLIEHYVRDLTAGSLQSTEEILRVGAAFDIKSSSITDDPKALTRVFRARNQIVHEMDVDFDRRNRNRTPRARQLMVDYTNRVFQTASAFLAGVDGKITQ